MAIKLFVSFPSLPLSPARPLSIVDRVLNSIYEETRIIQSTGKPRWLPSKRSPPSRPKSETSRISSGWIQQPPPVLSVEVRFHTASRPLDAETCRLRSTRLAWVRRARRRERVGSVNARPSSALLRFRQVAKLVPYQIGGAASRSGYPRYKYLEWGFIVDRFSRQQPRLGITRPGCRRPGGYWRRTFRVSLGLMEW